MTIARVSGSSTSVVGGIVSIVGLGLLPFTAGFSLILLGTGGGIAGLGGATNLGSNITLKIFHQKGHIKNLKRHKACLKALKTS